MIEIKASPHRIRVEDVVFDFCFQSRVQSIPLKAERYHL